MRYLALVVVVVLGGCIDFKEIVLPPPTPPAQAPAEFRASVSFHDRPGPEPVSGESPPRTASGIRIAATLHPGRDEHGQPRVIHDDTLRVAGTALTPVRVDDSGVRAYEGWVPLPERAQDGVLLSIVPPAVRGGARPGVLYQPVPVRIGTDTIPVAAGADLQLPLALPEPVAGPRPLDQGWNLDVGSGPSRLSISGEGLPPVPLVVPLRLIPQTAGQWLAARLFMHSRTRIGGREADYFIDVHFNASLNWIVHRTQNAAQN